MATQIQPCLWFNGQAEEAAKYYTSIFPDGKITKTDYFTAAGREHHGSEPGSVMMVNFKINNTNFLALNGGNTKFPFSPAISFTISCENQKEVDYYWDKLKEGGDEARQVCGWLEDKYGVSWQIVPKQMGTFIAGGGERAERVLGKMMEMKKMDVEVLRQAYEGEEK